MILKEGLYRGHSTVSLDHQKQGILTIVKSFDDNLFQWNESVR